MAGSNNENDINEISNYNESAVMSSLEAVSYTHLDVYKRQLQIVNRVLKIEKNRDIIRIRCISFNRLTTVIVVTFRIDQNSDHLQVVKPNL